MGIYNLNNINMSEDICKGETRIIKSSGILLSHYLETNENVDQVKKDAYDEESYHRTQEEKAKTKRNKLLRSELDNTFKIIEYVQMMFARLDNIAHAHSLQHEFDIQKKDCQETLDKKHEIINDLYGQLRQKDEE